MFYFTAAQAERIVAWFPPKRRVEPLVILFARIINLEYMYHCFYHLEMPITTPPKECEKMIKDHKLCTTEEFPQRPSEFHTLMCRLGALNMFNPYHLR